jgi:hypothetical protein
MLEKRNQKHSHRLSFMTEKIPRQEMPDRRLHLKYVGPSTVVGAADVVAFQNSGQGLNTGVTSMTTDVRRSKQEICRKHEKPNVAIYASVLTNLKYARKLIQQDSC